ncbi:MAG: type transport system ATP-binding protein [Pseudonocardiales bacterium]|nr:type transport system ATP-binding protein [Pseudonocardiales bacterium]
MLDIRDLTKSYGETRALDGVSLQVRAGQMYGFVGSNGAGKSTTMRIAMGVLAADSGSVRWRGDPVTFATRRRFGYMPEERGLYPKMRIADQIAYFGELHAMTAAAARASADALLQRLEVDAKPTDALQALSLGNQQRVQLAAALVHDPELLILDEPFSGLDPLGVDTMAAVLAERCARGAAVIFSSHQLELVERLCDEIAIIVRGRLVAQGTLSQLRENAAGRELEVIVDGPVSWVGDLVDRLAGARLVSTDPSGRVRLALAQETDDQVVLAAAARVGRVRQFGWREPPLAELYRSAVSS